MIAPEAGVALGAVAAGHRVEGDLNGPGQPANNWVWWERRGLAPPVGTAGRFWREPEKTLDQAVATGCRWIALSVEWARIAPAPGVTEHGALDQYRRILEGCRERGLEPHVCLLHLSHPAWLGEEFWLTPGSPDRFAAHVAEVVEALAPACDHWTPVHDPAGLVFEGWIVGTAPPGRRWSVSDGWTVFDNLLTAHWLAGAAIRSAQPAAEVGLSVRSSAIYERDKLGPDLLGAPGSGVEPGMLDQWLRDRRTIHDRWRPARSPFERWQRRMIAASVPRWSARSSDGAGARTAYWSWPWPRPWAATMARSVETGYRMAQVGSAAFDAVELGRAWPPSHPVPMGFEDGVGRVLGPLARALLAEREGSERWDTERSVPAPTVPIRVVDGLPGGRRALAGRLASINELAAAGVPIAGYGVPISALSDGWP